MRVVPHHTAGQSIHLWLRPQQFHIIHFRLIAALQSATHSLPSSRSFSTLAHIMRTVPSSTYIVPPLWTTTLFSSPICRPVSSRPDGLPRYRVGRLLSVCEIVHLESPIGLFIFSFRTQSSVLSVQWLPEPTRGWWWRGWIDDRVVDKKVYVSH